MIKLTVWLLALLLAAGCVKKPRLLTEKTLSSQQALEDFDHFTSILERGHPGLFSYQQPAAYNRLCDSITRLLGSPVTISRFYQLLSLVTSRIQCVHTGLDINETVYDELNGKPVFFPLPLALVRDTVVTNFSAGEIPEGSIIYSVNHKPVNDIVKNLISFNPVDGRYNTSATPLAVADFGFGYFWGYGPSDKFEITYLRPDSGATVQSGTFSAITLEDYNRRNNSQLYYADAMDIDYDLQCNDAEGYALLVVRTFDFASTSRSNAFNNFCANSFALLRTRPYIRNLIIDVRQNSGGNYVDCHQLFSYLYQKPYRQHDSANTIIKKIPAAAYLCGDSREEVSGIELAMAEDFSGYARGGYQMVDSVNATVQPSPVAFNGRVFVVTSAATSSAAAYFASLVQNSGRGVVVGEETSGGAYMHNGFYKVAYELPHSKITFHFSVVHVKHSFAGKAAWGRGVVPDYYRPSGWSDFKNNTDNQVEFIVDSLIKN